MSKTWDEHRERIVNMLGGSFVGPDDADGQALMAALDRIDNLESRVRQLESITPVVPDVVTLPNVTPEFLAQLDRLKASQKFAHMPSVIASAPTVLTDPEERAIAEAVSLGYDRDACPSCQKRTRVSSGRVWACDNPGCGARGMLPKPEDQPPRLYHVDVSWPMCVMAHDYTEAESIARKHAAHDARDNCEWDANARRSPMLTVGECLEEWLGCIPYDADLKEQRTCREILGGKPT